MSIEDYEVLFCNNMAVVFSNSNLRPVHRRGKPFCWCKPRASKLSCTCGEENNVHEWAWDEHNLPSSAHLTLDNREITFHSSYSSGTCVVRGNKPFVKGHYYYWELKMISPVYGTDMMVGVGTSKMNLREPEFHFCSSLGSNEESWGYSYTGSIQHNGIRSDYGLPFVQGSIVGIFLDMFRGKITFHLNRRPLGVAFDSVNADELYPMACSTAAKSGMRVIYSFSCKPSLQLLCLQTIGTSANLMKEFDAVPYFKNNLGKRYWWLLPNEESKEDEYDDYYFWKKKSSSHDKSTQQNLSTHEDDKITIEILDWPRTLVAEISFRHSSNPT